MRIERLARRIAEAPPSIAISLVVLSLLISPGVVRVSEPRGSGLRAEAPSEDFAARPAALLALHCRDGVYTRACLRLISRVTEALEAHADVEGPVRSLVRASRVRAASGALRLEPLAKPLPETERELRTLRARIRADSALEREFVSPDGQTSWVRAELVEGRGVSDAQALADSLRTAFERPLVFELQLVGATSEPRSRAGWIAAALLFAALGLALAPGGARALTLASVGALATGALAHALILLLGGAGTALSPWLPVLAAAAAFCSSLTLIARARAEYQRDPLPRAAIANALASLGAALSLSALAFASALAVWLVLDGSVPIARSLAVSAALALALLAYPVGVSLAGSIAWPTLLTAPASEVSAALGARAERVLAKPRAMALAGLLGLALAVGVLALRAPESGLVELRTVTLDSGAPGGALEPEFLERVDLFQRELSAQAGVHWTRSLVDSVLAPANRALHGDDPVFAGVPATRADVERALRPWAKERRSALERQIDPTHRRVSVEIFAQASPPEPAAAAPSAPASAILTLALIAGLAALGLRSASAAWACAAPAAASGLALLGLASALDGGPSGASASLAPIGVALCAGLALPYLARLRDLIESGARREIAQRVATRELAPALASAALIGSGLVAVFAAASAEPIPGAIVAALVTPLAAASALALVPVLVRARRTRSSGESAALRRSVSGGES